jgi:hypothetical protein
MVLLPTTVALVAICLIRQVVLKGCSIFQNLKIIALTATMVRWLKLTCEQAFQRQAGMTLSGIGGYMI